MSKRGIPNGLKVDIKSANRFFQGLKEEPKKPSLTEIENQELVSKIVPAMERYYICSVAKFVVRHVTIKAQGIAIYEKWESVCKAYLQEYLSDTVFGIDKGELYQACDLVKIGTLLYMLSPEAKKADAFQRVKIAESCKQDIWTYIEKIMPSVTKMALEPDNEGNEYRYAEKVLAHAQRNYEKDSTAKYTVFGISYMLLCKKEELEKRDLIKELYVLFWSSHEEYYPRGQIDTENDRLLYIIKKVYAFQFRNGRKLEDLKEHYRDEKLDELVNEAPDIPHKGLSGDAVAQPVFMEMVMQRFGLDEDEIVFSKADRAAIAGFMSKSDIHVDKVCEGKMMAGNIREEYEYYFSHSSDAIWSAFLGYGMAKALSERRKKDILSTLNGNVPDIKVQKEDSLKARLNEQEQELAKYRLELEEKDRQIQNLKVKEETVNENYYRQLNKATALQVRLENIEQEMESLSAEAGKKEKEEQKQAKDDCIDSLIPVEQSAEPDEVAAERQTVENSVIEGNIRALTGMFDILIVGGNRNLTKKLGDKYPKLHIWDTDQDMAESFIGSMDYILFKHDSMGHKTYNKTKQVAKSKGILYDYLLPVTSIPLVEKDLYEKVMGVFSSLAEKF